MSTVSLQHSVEENGLDDKATLAFCESFLVSKTNRNLLFTIRKNIYAVYLYVFVIYESYMRKIYDMICYNMI